jgi:hypothetical protein
MIPTSRWSVILGIAAAVLVAPMAAAAAAADAGPSELRAPALMRPFTPEDLVLLEVRRTICW